MLTSDYYPYIGGIASHIVGLSNALRKRDHTVEVWAYLGEGIRPGDISDIPTKELGYSAPFISNAYTQAKVFVPSIKEMINRFHPDIIHCHTMAPLSLSCRWVKSKKYRTIFTNHSSGYLVLIATFWGRLKAKYYCGHFDGLLAPSEELLEKSNILKYDPYRKQYIPNGVDTNKFKPESKENARCLLKIDQYKFVMLCTRRFVSKNGVRYLAEALPLISRDIPNMLCVFCGNTENDEEYRIIMDIVKKYNLYSIVRFEGSVPNNDIITYLHAADIVVLPSLIEATSISGLEALSCGKAVIGTNVGGIPYIVRDGQHGLLVPPANHVALASAIVKIAKNSNIVLIERECRKRAEIEFDWSVISDRTIGFYEQILNLNSRYFR